MPTYTFTFKKDDIFVEFTTEDKEVVERQFQLWVADADNYARDKEVKGKGEKEKEENLSSVHPFTPSPEENSSTIQPFDHSTKEIASSEAEPVIDKASALLKTINSIQNEQALETEDENNNSLSFDISSSASQPTEAEEVSTSPKESADFEVVLEKAVENPTFEPDRVKDQVFLNLIKSKNTTDKFHYLIITAYYLSVFEKMERYSLKQINAKLMQNLSEVIDHATLQEALIQNLLELVPDLTGIAEVGEYKLTRLGEEFFANKI